MLESFYAEYAQRIATLVTHYGLVGMPKRLPLTNAFERLSVGLRLSDLRTAENSALWELADKELQWHIETFLEPIGASRICGLFADTPSDIWKVFRVLVSDANFKASPRTVLLTPANETEYASSSAEVFCSRAILAQLFAVAFDNMSKYVNPSLQDGRVQYRATTSEAGNFLTFLLENDNTTIAESAQENRLHALELMAADVANFGGELTHGRCELVGGGWQPTFFLKLRLFKWTENV